MSEKLKAEDLCCYVSRWGSLSSWWEVDEESEETSQLHNGIQRFMGGGLGIMELIECDHGKSLK